eukprot:GHVP01006512.1.p1 GENE.GHVP01006512.1~~GHVP01006512.1.p1  ORF type:complete len:136 (-),score=24.02 GHVP01006512.1:234-641(-)
MLSNSQVSYSADTISSQWVFSQTNSNCGPNKNNQISYNMRNQVSGLSAEKRKLYKDILKRGKMLTLISFQESNEIEESKEKILEALKLLKKKRFDKFVESCTYKGVEVFVCRTTNGFYNAFAQLDSKPFLLFELD